MNLSIPGSLKVEHDELHEELVKATKEPGAVGEAAKRVAKLLHPHFVKEEEYALPPLGLLADVAEGRITPEMKDVLRLTDKLKADLPEMLKEHGAIVGALESLSKAAGEAGGAPFGAGSIERLRCRDECGVPRLGGGSRRAGA